MKICKACGEVNEDENLVCKNGDCLSREFEDYETVKRNVDSNLKRKEKLKSVLEKTIFVIYLIGVLIACTLNFRLLSLSEIISTIVLGIVGVMCIKFTSLVFEIQHIFSLKDSSGDNMADIYESYLKVIGVLALIYSIYILF
ncbi:hypothetical protein P5F04_02285 [Clostridium perfringens]|uniref:hypothetical protein n=1 Tax=Clostridium perfringens TaxID=1502 RepID=UPI001F06F498|nr:hypothetical protein [Clostridium perfringens]MCH1963432.1 hypothetical protein [Clostridium perfringens]MDK0536937.1 hypothetical protein [Clostridium perfringens]MDK0564835.1 hypothetical protein [Clostridium perfringens]MDK0569778.1 hypothetical protein [Clostridium perfringens]MDK0625720.1 hypothetical protein [Clostridium perfringens]